MRTKALSTIAFSALFAAAGAMAADPGVIELKDGGMITLDKDGKTIHTDASGKRVRMKDGVVMEGKDGAKYLMKNDAIWNQVTEKGTLAPNR